LTMTPPSFGANLNASADLPLAVGPAMRIAVNERPLIGLSEHHREHEFYTSR
jgi:hypothetical protein